LGKARSVRPEDGSSRSLKLEISPEIKPNMRRFGIIAFTVFVADQVTKWMAVANLTTAFGPLPGKQAAATFGEQLSRFLWHQHPARSNIVAVLDDFWHFRYVENPGAAFGLFAGQAAWFRTPFFVVVTILAMGFILYLYRSSEPAQVLTRWSLALIFGGAVGNLVDRIRLGYVIDFIDWHWYNVATWPTFNIADSAISIGVTLLIIDMWRNGPEEGLPETEG